MHRNTDSRERHAIRDRDPRSINGDRDISADLPYYRTIEKADLDKHFDNIPLWKFAETTQQQGSLLVPVCAMLLFCICGLGLCYQAAT